MWIAVVQIDCDPQRIVRRTIVHHDEFPVRGHFCGRFRYASMEFADEVGRFVERRHHGQADCHSFFMKSSACGPVQKSRSSTLTECSNGPCGCEYSGYPE